MASSRMWLSMLSRSSSNQTRGFGCYACSHRPLKRTVADWINARERQLKYPDEPGFGPGSDFEHWRVFTKPLKGFPPKDQIIRYYIHILSQLVGSEEEAVKKIYSVATRHYYAFGANVSIELATKIHDLPEVSCAVPDAYVDPIQKRYPWDPFIGGKALPYDPKYYPNGDFSSLSDEELGIERQLSNLPPPGAKC